MNTECCTWVVKPGGEGEWTDSFLLIPSEKAAVAHLNLCTNSPDECGACQQSLEILWKEENENVH